MNSSGNSQKIYNNQFILKKKLSQGSYGIVFEGEDQQTKKQVAIKVEKKEKTSTLDREIHILTRLQGTQGVPKLYWSGIDNNTNVIILQYLSKDLGNYLKELRKFSLKTVLLIADQLFQTIRRVHNKSVVHRDLKPENLMFHQKSIYIVDFGISKLFRDTNLKHIQFKEGRPFVGTTRYASIAAHKGQELGRKDDLESLIYIFVLMLKGLVIEIFRIKKFTMERQRFVGDKKSKMTPIEVCCDLPLEFSKALEYIRGLQFQSDPDYEYLIQLFRKLAQSNGISYDEQFDWNNSQNLNPSGTKQICSMIQFEKQPLATQNKYSSLQIPSTGDVVEKKRTTIVSRSNVQNNSLISHNSYQQSQINLDDNFEQDVMTIEDEDDTLYVRYMQLVTQVLVIPHPTLMKIK